MSIRKLHPDLTGIYSITFTCYNWLPLFAEANAWELVYRQFEALKTQGHNLNGYVIMPNHVHALIHFKLECIDLIKKNQAGLGAINHAISNMKRFLAYDLIDLLETGHHSALLQQLATGRSFTERSRGKKHRVFQPSFDCKLCYSEKLVWQKLNYFHNNPCTGKWNLAPTPLEYPHSSCLFYETGKQGLYEVADFRLNR